MAETNISWADYTYNPWRGCQRVSEGCRFCYAEAMSHRNPEVLGEWGPEGKRVIAAKSYWKQPLKWNRDAAAAGERRRVFCGSLMDVFEDRPELIVPRCRLLSVIHQTPNLDWLLLTKRPEGIRDRLHECSTHEDIDHGDGGKLGINDGASLASQWKHGSPMSNIWLGVSIENQKVVCERTPILRQIPAKVRFLSAEPLLEDLGNIDLSGISWVIVGGESGPHRRPFEVEWAESLYQQCHKAGVAFFLKQDMGARPGMQGRIPDWLWNVKEFPLVSGGAG